MYFVLRVLQAKVFLGALWPEVPLHLGVLWSKLGVLLTELCRDWPKVSRGRTPSLRDTFY